MFRIYTQIELTRGGYFFAYLLYDISIELFIITLFNIHYNIINYNIIYHVLELAGIPAEDFILPMSFCRC